MSQKKNLSDMFDDDFEVTYEEEPRVSLNDSDHAENTQRFGQTRVFNGNSSSDTIVMDSPYHASDHGNDDYNNTSNNRYAHDYTDDYDDDYDNRYDNNYNDGYGDRYDDDYDDDYDDRYDDDYDDDYDDRYDDNYDDDYDNRYDDDYDDDYDDRYDDDYDDDYDDRYNRRNTSNSRRSGSSDRHGNQRNSRQDDSYDDRRSSRQNDPYDDRRNNRQDDPYGNRRNNSSNRNNRYNDRYDDRYDNDRGSRKSKKRRRGGGGVPLAAPIKQGGKALSHLTSILLQQLSVILIIVTTAYVLYNFWRASTPYGDIAEAIKTQKISRTLAAYVSVAGIYLFCEFISLLWTMTRVRVRNGMDTWREDTGRGFLSFIMVFVISYICFLFSPLLPDSPDIVYGVKGALDVYGSLHNGLLGLCAAGAVSCLIRRYKSH